MSVVVARMQNVRYSPARARARKRESERERELSRRFSVLGIDPPAGNAAFEFRNPGRRLTIISEGVFSKSATGSPATVSLAVVAGISPSREISGRGDQGESGWDSGNSGRREKRRPSGKSR